MISASAGSIGSSAVIETTVQGIGVSSQLSEASAVIATSTMRRSGGQSSLGSAPNSVISGAVVSTTVIEVGVDAPEARLMVIENAERFGLSQLHQLRGRIGRGPGRSVCVLMLGGPAGTVARERVETMCRTTDGFEIAEADLRLRGPGNDLS